MGGGGGKSVRLRWQAGDLEAGELPISRSGKQSIFYASFQPGQGAEINHRVTQPLPCYYNKQLGGPPKPGTTAGQTGAFPFAFYLDSLVALWGFAASFFASYGPETLPVKPQSDIKKKKREAGLAASCC